MSIEVLAGGALTTVQDGGRFGYAAQGYGCCGACDKHAYRLANALVGNSPDLATLECTLLGPTLHFGKPAVVAVTGAHPAVMINGRPVPAYLPLPINAGDTLSVGEVTGGARCYVAVQGGLDVPLLMGSRSTDLRCHLGGLEGRALRKGDRVPISEVGAQREQFLRRLPGKLRQLAAMDCQGWMERAYGPFRFCGDVKTPLVRVVDGPQDGRFAADGLLAFTRGEYRVAADSNRMACRLEGEPIQASSGYDILSDGILEGSVQVSANGLPLVMLADHQTTGGYAKIATVISADIPALAQLRPGDTLAFRRVSPALGARACRLENRMLQKIRGLMKT